MEAGSFGQLATWGAVAIVIVVLIASVIDESDDHKSKDMFGRKKQPQDGAQDAKATPMNAKPSSSVAKDEMPRIGTTANTSKPLIPPPGEARIEAVAPRNKGHRR